MVRRAVQQKRSDNDFNARNEDRSLQGAAAWKGYQQQILKAKERTPAKTERMDCVLIPVAHRFFADTNRGSNITFERCPFLRNEAKDSGSVYFVRLFPSCAPLYTQNSLLEEASTLPSRPATPCQHDVLCPFV